MTNSRGRKTFPLLQHEILHLPGARGSIVRVHRGVVWLTMHRDARDVVLFAGDSWMVENGGLTLLEAQRDATVTITGPGVERAHRHRYRPSLVERAARWLQQTLGTWV